MEVIFGILAYLCVGAAIGIAVRNPDDTDNSIVFASAFGWGFILIFTIVAIIAIIINAIFDFFTETFDL